jgi:hypothetical protein
MRHATLDGADMVPNDASDAEASSTPSPQRGVDRIGPTGQLLLAPEVASFRRRFIREFAQGEGIPTAVLEKRWTRSKNGYPTSYDKPF